MRYYKVIYELGTNKEYIYPPCTERVVWNLAQYHFTEHKMIGITNSEVEADGVEVVELTEKEASSLIEEFKKSYSETPEEEPTSLPERDENAETAQTDSL